MADTQQMPSVKTETTTSPSTPTHSISCQLSNFDDENNSQIDIVNIPDEYGNAFLKFLNFDIAKEETKFNDSVELMLTKLDEFFSLVDMIRSDTSLCLQNTMPDIQMKCKEMDAVFEKIDRLEDFVNIVKESVVTVEEKVNKAESELGAVGGFIKKLSSFISKKPSPALTPSRNKGPEFVPPDIFSTKDYFDHSMETETSIAASVPGPSVMSANPQDSNQESGNSST
ncbi:biogenesis of lysosome-related organelles complex 1 subunit 4-like [Elysia marginata]|uniref:Biogenesis of lysosome-related organelles complex 1 subunit 4-like n=1 Tax=Elysia marginata TaxID=1093978 RepID=A0AAV4IVL2_9GAST|nr:biogenesis of lysosome-related organelles complex 1 subunit 4-like [Elysia marginata]